jgi:hypothetical protein
MRALLVLTLLAGCSEKNPYYCEGHPDNNCLLDADINAPQGCSTSAQCTNSAKPICEPTQKICVACTDGMPGACAGTTPVCSTANTCSACSAHDQCDSDACLPTGACGDDAVVAYVAAGGDDGGTCTRAVPCGSITAAATKGKPYVKVQTDLMEAVQINNASVTILGTPGTGVERSTQGPVVTLTGTSNVTIRDLSIRTGLGPTGHGIVVNSGEPVNLTLDRVYVLGNTGTGIIALGGSLTMSRCVVSGNLAGGAKVETTFNIANSLFVANGSAGSLIGGLSLTPGGTVSFKFNTVANNASSNAVKGINCVFPMAITNTILSMNESATNCAFEFSLFDPTATANGSNRAGEPKFKTTNSNDPFAPDYFRIQSSSDAVDRGDPASMMSTDIDGDARPNGSAPDIGADELH